MYQSFGTVADCKVTLVALVALVCGLYLIGTEDACQPSM